ncbi:anti-sigma factor family protein [Planctomycetaceae bacterium SH139]
MSLPRELLDDLLSRYMDDQLSDDERQRVEQMLADDAGARRQLEQLRAQSAMIRQAMESTPRLPKDFASRVLELVGEEAAAADLSASHPVRLAVRPKDPNRSQQKNSPTGGRAAIWSMLAAAATIAAISFYLSRGDQQTLPLQLADSETSQTGDSQRSDMPVPDAGQPNVVRPDVIQPDATQIADNAVRPGDASATTNSAVAEPAMTAGDNTSQNNSSAIAAADPTATAAGDLPADLQQLNAMFVYEVEVTELGLKNNVVGRLFREVGISRTERRNVDDALVGFLQRDNLLAVDQDGSTVGANLIFLEGSGLKLDALMLRFLETRGEVKRVGFSMLMNPPVMVARDTNADPVDPRNVRRPDDAAGDRNELVAHRLMPENRNLGNATASAAASFIAGDHRFIPLNRETLGSLRPLDTPTAKDNATAGTNNDLTAQVLLIVRFPK